MLESPPSPTCHRILWTIKEQDTESAASARSSYVSAETDNLTLNGARYFMHAQNVAAGCVAPPMNRNTFDTTACPHTRSPRQSNDLIPVGKFSAWTRFRTTFIASSPELLQHRLAKGVTQAGKEDANLAAILLKTITVLANASVHKLGDVNAAFTRDERWLRDNIQPIVQTFDALSRDHGYAEKSKNSAKRYLYESAARALRHLKAIDDDQRIVAQQALLFQTDRSKETDEST